MKPRILQLVDSFDEGGSERQALQLTRLLHESGRYEVFLASLKPKGVLRADVECLGLGEIPSYPLNSFFDRNAIYQLRRFVKYLRSQKIDLLHTHDFYTNIFGMAAGYLAGVNVRIASRRETSGMRSNAQRRAQQLAYWLANRIVANSDSVRQKLVEEGIAEKKIRVIYNGLDLRRVSTLNAGDGSLNADHGRRELLKALGISADPNARFVTIVANMRHEVKDYPMFLRAAKRVKEAQPDAAFLLAGEGALRSSLEAMAAQLGIADSTTFLGRAKNIAQLLQLSEVCVLSSKAEGFSNSILEYMAASRPVVATDVGGAREAIVEGETGYLVPSGNDELMAERIVSLLGEPDRARLMGEKGRRIVTETFSTQAQLHHTEELYQELFVGASLGGRPDASRKVNWETIGAPTEGRPYKS